MSVLKFHKNLTFQDALIAIAVYAAQIDPSEPHSDIKQIENLAKEYPLFNEDAKALRARINKFVNSMQNENSLDIVKRAAYSLTPGYRETAFKWAAQLIQAKDELSEGQNEIIDELKIKLSIDANTAKKIIPQNSNG